jgi:hypothetical protein
MLIYSQESGRVGLELMRAGRSPSQEDWGDVARRFSIHLGMMET